ncbi:hypothetical protein M885DRAFT_544600 [Pelagophyceae sp. CCMP2097]|nr:hypothetical protein M885DRAFT_544600 [Pelagophyceae sp. CCMP2097]
MGASPSHASAPPRGVEAAPSRGGQRSAEGLRSEGRSSEERCSEGFRSERRRSERPSEGPGRSEGRLSLCEDGAFAADAAVLAFAEVAGDAEALRPLLDLLEAAAALVEELRLDCGEAASELVVLERREAVEEAVQQQDAPAVAEAAAALVAALRGCGSEATCGSEAALEAALASLQQRFDGSKAYHSKQLADEARCRGALARNGVAARQEKEMERADEAAFEAVLLLNSKARGLRRSGADLEEKHFEERRLLARRRFDAEKRHEDERRGLSKQQAQLEKQQDDEARYLAEQLLDHSQRRLEEDGRAHDRARRRHALADEPPRLEGETPRISFKFLAAEAHQID